MDISVIIPTHDRSLILEQTLSHLACQRFAGKWEIIVVNSNCTDETDRVVRSSQAEFSTEVKLVYAERRGAAAARNAGAKAAAGKFLLFMDDDILAEPDFVSKHFAGVSGNEGYWIVGQFPFLPEQEKTVFGRYARTLSPLLPDDSGIIEAEGISGQGTSLPREDFEKLGGFDENFFVASGEDRDLAFRAREAGIRFLTDPSIKALHNDWAVSSIRDFCRRQRIYSQTEAYFGRKYGSTYDRAELVKENSSPQIGKDGPTLYARKMIKKLLATTLFQEITIRTARLLERMMPDSRMLYTTYRLAIAGAIFKGFQEGEKSNVR